VQASLHDCDPEGPHVAHELRAGHDAVALARFVSTGIARGLAQQRRTGGLDDDAGGWLTAGLNASVRGLRRLRGWCFLRGILNWLSVLSRAG
jgi:hypothetical protein